MSRKAPSGHEDAERSRHSKQSVKRSVTGMICTGQELTERPEERQAAIEERHEVRVVSIQTAMKTPNIHMGAETTNERLVTTEGSSHKGKEIEKGAELLGGSQIAGRALDGKGVPNSRVSTMSRDDVSTYRQQGAR